MADISLDYLRPAVEHDPRRAVNAGIMEQSAVGIAAGFALEGFHPIVHTLAPFLTERPLEQIKLDFGYQGLGGTFISAGAAVRLRRVRRDAPRCRRRPGARKHPGARGARAGSAPETDALLRASYANGRPTYLRTSVVENREPVELAPGGLTVVRRGAELTVIAAGPFLSRTLDALDGIDATVLYATTLVPLDAETLAREAAPSPKVVLVEPAYEGTSAAQIAAALSHRPTQLLSIGVPRRFIERYGTSAEHDAALGLDVRGIRERMLGFLRCLTPRVSDTQAGLPARPEAGVAVALCDELVVRRDLDKPPVLHHRHAVGALRRREPVRDRDHRAPVREHGQRVLDRRLRLRVERRRRLVEHDHHGSTSATRAIETSWRSPAERRTPRERTSVASPSGSASSRDSAPIARSASRTSSSLASGRPSRTLSAIDPENSGPPAGRRRCASATRRASRRAGRLPPSETDPCCGSYARTSSFASVDLPAPVAPTSARCSPGVDGRARRRRPPARCRRTRT